MRTKKAVVVNNYYDETNDAICVELYNESWGRFVIPYYAWSQNYSKSSDLHPAKLVIGTKVLVRSYDPESVGAYEYDITKRLTPISVSKRKLERDLEVPYMTIKQIDKQAYLLLKKLKQISKQNTK